MLSNARPNDPFFTTLLRWLSVYTRVSAKKISEIFSSLFLKVKVLKIGEKKIENFFLNFSGHPSVHLRHNGFYIIGSKIRVLLRDLFVQYCKVR